jgi:tetratricopeptide (TPR) repeat protein
MIVKNEASILQRCLNSVKDAADEIIVVDTGSGDKTPSIAQSFGCTLVQSEWRDDFSYSRNISIDHAKGAWILWLDADDVVPPVSIPILNSLKKETPDKVFAMIVRNQKPGGTGTEFFQARMFPRRRQIRFERPIHEQIMLSALRVGLSLVNTAAIIEHHGYCDEDTMKKKARRNITLLLKNLDTTTEDPVTFIEIADACQIAQDDEQARIWYEKIIASDVSEHLFPVIVSQAHTGMGNIFNRNELFAEAIDHFQQAARLCPQRTDVLFCMAVSHDMLGEKEKAVALLRQVISMQPAVIQVGVDFRLTSIKSYLRLIRILIESGDRDELLKICSRALEECINRPEIHNAVGVAYLGMNRLMDSLHCFEKSLSIAIEGNIDAYLGLCSIYLKAARRELLEQTLMQIQPLFDSFTRYWAFSILSGVSTYNNIINNKHLKEEEIDGEIKFLKQTYRITEQQVIKITES